MDPNLPDEKQVTELETVTEISPKGSGDVDEKDSAVATETEVEEDSIYPEIRAAVSNKDDPNMPCVQLHLTLLCLLKLNIRKPSEFGLWGLFFQSLVPDSTHYSP